VKTGIIQAEPSVDYHGNGAVSSSTLADMRVAGVVCPLNYYVRHVAKTAPRKKGAHFNIGIAAHLAILEGEAAFDAGCVMQPETYKNEKGEVKPWHNGSNACKAWAAGAAGRIILDREEADLILAMANAIKSNPDACALTIGGEAEVTFRKEIAGLVLQCRVDKWHPNGAPWHGLKHPLIVDLKTCNTLEQFEREFYFLRYNVRAEFYRLVTTEVLADLAGVPASELVPPTYAFVVVEKTVPHRVKVYTPDPESLEAGRRDVHADLLTLRECRASGKWPSGTEGMHSIGLKTWQLAKSDAANDAAMAAL